jgi:hypothetical protein
MQPLESFGYGGSPVLVQDAMAVSTATATETEPNDDRSLATEIELDTEVGGSLSTAEVDWYAFDVRQGNTFTVEVTRSSADGVSLVAVFGPDGDNLDQVYIGYDTPATVTETAEQSGTYYAEVVDVNQGDGEYALTVWDGETQPTATPTPTPEPTATPTPTPEPTATPTPTPEPTATPTPTPEPTATPTPDDGQASFGDGPWELPGRIEAEDFDVGGQGVAYEDNDDVSWGVYRTDESVDIGSPDTGEYNVGWTHDGDWLEYTTTVPGGTYDVNVRVAADGGGNSKAVRVTLDGVTLGSVDVPDTGGWNSWATQTIPDVSVQGGTEVVLRMDIVGGSFNVDWIEFEASEAVQTSTPTPEPTATPTPTPEPTATPTPASDEYGVQGYGKYGYGG